MPRYEVFATRWDDPHAIEEQIPAVDLEFTLPLSDHGECTFTATVEPGRSYWRPALSAAVSGVLVVVDEQPAWSGMMISETQNGPRSFGFSCREWGTFFADVPAFPYTYSQVNDHAIFRHLIAYAQVLPEQNPQIVLPSTFGATSSDLTINWWDSTTVAEEFTRLAEAEGGPEWYFAATGSLDTPTRTLILGDRLGSTDPVALLEYVEDTVEDDQRAADPPTSILNVGRLFPGQQPYAVVGGRRGGNVIAHPARGQMLGYSAARAIGGGEGAMQHRATAKAETLLANGYPLRTRTQQYQDVTIHATIERHAAADLAASAGMTTSYTLSTFESDPDWRSIARGDTIRVELDTDVYGEQRPVEFSGRVLEIAVKVPNDGQAEVNYTLASVQEI